MREDKKHRSHAEPNFSVPTMTRKRCPAACRKRSPALLRLGALAEGCLRCPDGFQDREFRRVTSIHKAWEEQERTHQGLSEEKAQPPHHMASDCFGFEIVSNADRPAYVFGLADHPLLLLMPRTSCILFGRVKNFFSTLSRFTRQRNRYSPCIPKLVLRNDGGQRRGMVYFQHV